MHVSFSIHSVVHTRMDEALINSASAFYCCLVPAGAMIAIAFVHNLLRRHPACTVLLHRPLPSAPGHADARAAAAEGSSAANGQAVQTSGGVSEANGTAQQEARPDDQHTSEHTAFHPFLSLC